MASTDWNHLRRRRPMETSSTHISESSRRSDRGVGLGALALRRVACGRLGVVVILLLCIVASSCAMPERLAMTAAAAITGTEIVVSGTANVPDDALLLCEVREEGNEAAIAQGAVAVKDGKYLYSASLGDTRSGSLEAAIIFTMLSTESFSQPERIIEIYGTNGEKLRGGQIVDIGDTKIGLVTTTVAYVRPVAHQVLKKTDVSPLDAERILIWYVVVDGQPSPIELNKLADKLIADCKDEAPFNALSLRFYDYPQYIEQYCAYTVGKVDYAPWGDFAKGLMIKAGEYNVMRRSDHLPAKDWSGQLTPDEVEIWEATAIEYSKRRDLLASPADEVDEELLFADVARELGRTVDQVKRSYLKFASWGTTD